eukprot:gene16546-34471_t
MSCQESLIIRLASENDIDELLLLETLRWEIHLRADSNQIIQRIRRHPSGQFVVQIDGKVCGVLYTQRIKDAQILLESTFSNHWCLHDNSGPCMQLIAIAANSPSGGNIAAILRDHALQNAGNDSTITDVVAMTRCSTFDKSKLKIENMQSYQEFIYSIKDPTIFFHVSGGAEIVQIVPLYRPEDFSNLGCAVMIRYNVNHEYKESMIATKGTSSSTSSGTAHSSSPISVTEDKLKLNGKYLTLSIEISNEISTMVKGVVPEEVVDIPFMTIIDSLQLMTLHSWLEARIGKTLSPSFLFQYPSAKAVQDHFVGVTTASTTMAGTTSETNIKRLLTRNRQQSEVADSTDDDSSYYDVSIVGVSCLLPGNINSMDQLWDTLENKQDMTGE